MAWKRLLTIVFFSAWVLISPITTYARYYDPDVGRFASADTIVPSAMDPQSLNRYAYVRNNPAVLTDPSGHSWLSKGWNKLVREILNNPPKPENPSTSSGGQETKPESNGEAIFRPDQIQSAQKFAQITISPAYFVTNIVMEGAFDKLLESHDAKGFLSKIIGHDASKTEMGVAALALGVSLSAAYETVVGYAIDSFPGGKSVDKGYWDRPVANRNNVGFQGNKYPSPLNEGAKGSLWLNNNVFAINAISGLHDIFQISAKGAMRESNMYNYGGMAVAGMATYTAIMYSPLNTSFQFLHQSRSNMPSLEQFRYFNEEQR